jgi:hypothetical protein
MFKCLFVSLFILFLWSSIGICKLEDNEDVFKASVAARQNLLSKLKAVLTYTLEEPENHAKETGTISIKLNDSSSEMVVTPDKSATKIVSLQPDEPLTEVKRGGVWYDYFPDQKRIYLSTRPRSDGMLGVIVPYLFRQTPFTTEPLSLLKGKFNIVKDGVYYKLHVEDDGIRDYCYDSSKGFDLASYEYTNIGYVFKNISTVKVSEGLYLPESWQLSLTYQGKIFRTVTFRVTSITTKDPIGEILAPSVHDCIFIDTISRTSYQIR